jgi:aspartate aminotransferase
LTDRINRIEVSATMAITAALSCAEAEGRGHQSPGRLRRGRAALRHAPRHIKDAAIEAIEKNFTRYTAVAGIPEVRKAIVDRHACDFGSNYTPEECVFTTGGKLALFNAIQVLVDHGDEVILPVPYWVSFKDIIQYAGGKVVFRREPRRRELPHHREDDRSRDHAAHQGDHPEHAVEPLRRGRIAGRPRAIVRLAHKHEHLRAARRVLRLPELHRRDRQRRLVHRLQRAHVVVLGSLSKTYAMTGWRAGFALGPKPIIAAMSKLQSQSTSNTASMVQRASIAALTGSQECVGEMRADYIKLRDRVLEGFKTIPGLTCTVPRARSTSIRTSAPSSARAASLRRPIWRRSC